MRISQCFLLKALNNNNLIFHVVARPEFSVLWDKSHRDQQELRDFAVLHDTTIKQPYFTRDQKMFLRLHFTKRTTTTTTTTGIATERGIHKSKHNHCIMIHSLPHPAAQEPLSSSCGFVFYSFQCSCNLVKLHEALETIPQNEMCLPELSRKGFHNFQIEIFATDSFHFLNAYPNDTRQ